jgi:hypothetical protein
LKYYIDRYLDRKANEENPVSDVGSIRLLLLRKTAGHVAAEISEDKMADDGEAIDSMGPMFDEYANWWELNQYIDPEGTPPPFEIG